MRTRIFGAVYAALAALLACAGAAGAAPESTIAPGGCVVIPDDRGNIVGECPLEHTDVEVEIAGFLARVTLTQRFSNPYTDPIEAVYTFPMSDRAAVDTMVMHVGDRVIRGIIKERDEAQRIYQQARDAGKTASLLDQERPNIFTQSVANILPGDAIEITISYVEYLKYEDGEYEFSFPMVVGPRYIPGGQTAPLPDPPDEPKPAPLQEPLPDRPEVMPWPRSGREVPDAHRITPPVTPEGTRAGHDISLAVNLDAGFPIQDIESVLHEVEVESPSPERAIIRLKNQKEIPNRDFVLKYAVAGDGIEDAVLTHAGPDGNFVSLILQPPDRVAPDAITPKEMIFVIDVSGSMRGFPIEKAKQTMRLCIEGMNPDDTFNLVSFAGGLGYCFDGPVPHTAQNRTKALEYLANLEGSGGTEMMQAIRAALANQNDPDRLRVVCFMTDGYIGNDMAILDAIQQHAQTARVFSFGIGSSVNRFLIEGMARAGRGAAEVVTLESDGDAAALRFHERIQSPLLTDIRIEFNGLPIEDVSPSPDAMPDLFASRPLVLTGRYRGHGQGAITLRGMTAAGPFERTIPVTLPGRNAENEVLASLWARCQIEELMAQDWLGVQHGAPAGGIKGAITELGLNFSLVTQYTSFVAVEERIVTKGGKPQTVQVPVEMPDGVSYEGVFGKEEAEQLHALGYAGQSKAALAAPTEAPMRVSRGRQVNAPVARDLARKAQPSQPAEESADKDAITAKLAPSLRNLEAKVQGGNYTNGPVKVRNGWVRVFVRVSELNQSTAQALRNAGARIISEMQSGKIVYVAVKLEDLEKLAALKVVLRIDPPKL